MSDEYATLRAAFHAGETIQVWRLNDGAIGSHDGQWHDITGEPIFSCPVHLYRVKPEDVA